LKVLIADDDRLVRTMVSDLLLELGHSVIEAANGAEAVALALTAISDRSFRTLDGAEAVDVLLEKPVTRRSLARALARATRA
jgi:CheY-like chemotaxis protein